MHKNFCPFQLMKRGRGQRIPHDGLWDLEVQFCIHKGSPIIPTLSWINIIPDFDIYFFKIHSNIFLPSNPRHFLDTFNCEGSLVIVFVVIITFHNLKILYIAQIIFLGSCWCFCLRNWFSNCNYTQYVSKTQYWNAKSNKKP